MQSHTSLIKRTLRHRVLFSLILILLSETLYGRANGEVSMNESERLLPFTEWFDPQLRPILEAKLLVTPANYGRMITMWRPNLGESAVSLYCKAAGAEADCFVTLTRAQRSLDYVMANHREDADPLREVKKVNVVRKDARIPNQLAATFRRCVGVLLPKTGDRRVDPVVGWGFDRIEFWLCEPGAGCKKSDAPNHPGNRIRALIKMGDLLARYCETAESNRPAIATLMQAEADRILRK